MKKQQKKIALLILMALILTTVRGSIPIAQATQQATPKKAIYLIPGFMGSQLYSSSTLHQNVWVGPGTLGDIALDAMGLTPELANNSSGTGMTAYPDRDRDITGTALLCYPLKLSIEASLKLSGLSNTYTLEFFPYNWVADVNETAKLLDKDIKAKGYTSVILIGYSNGGLVASAYLALDKNNYKKVEKAIFLAASMWGTYITLEPVENGGISLYDGHLMGAMLDIGYNLFVRPISRHWVQTWAKNAPGLYQLFGHSEYVKRVPVYAVSSTGTKAITTPSEYYALLKKSAHTNNNLVDGNSHSLKYLSDTVFKGDSFSVWKNVDVTIIGCESGFLTPNTVVYNVNGNTATYAGALYTMDGDGIVTALSMKGSSNFRFINLPLAEHLALPSDARTITLVNQIILGQPLTDFSKSLPNPLGEILSFRNNVNATMADFVRVELCSNSTETADENGIIVNLYDSKGKLVASNSSTNSNLSFSNKGLVLENWKSDQYATNLMLYLPAASGCRLEVIGRDPSCPLNMVITTLTAAGGFKERTEYSIKGATKQGLFCNLNLDKVLAIKPSDSSVLTKLASTVFASNWTFAQKNVSVKKGASYTAVLSGLDAAAVKLNSLIWTSSDTKVATVTNGVIKAVGKGKATITAITQDGSMLCETFTITVE